MSLTVKIKKKLGSFDLDVEFDAGREVLALLGSSGCGKSMTLKCIAGIEKPDEGFISLDGRVLFDSKKHVNLSPQQRRVGYLFQQYALFPNMNVYDNIASGVRRENRAGREETVQSMIKSMRLEGLEKRRPSQLSGGQQQRVALARILVNEPELLLLDEPFSALDSYLRWQMELEVSDTLRAFPGTSVFVSHDRDEVYRLCDSVCILTAGKSEDKAGVKELFAAPRTLSACLMTGCKNFSRVEKLDGTHVRALDWGAVLEVPAVPEGARCAGVRAHDVKPGPGVNQLECRVRRRADDMFSDIVMLETPGGGEGWSAVRMEAPSGELPDMSEGDNVTVNMPGEKIMILI
jgi:molybdate transport system ATP-binding protein